MPWIMRLLQFDYKHNNNTRDQGDNYFYKFFKVIKIILYRLLLLLLLVYTDYNKIYRQII